MEKLLMFKKQKYYLPIHTALCYDSCWNVNLGQNIQMCMRLSTCLNAVHSRDEFISVVHNKNPILNYRVQISISTAVLMEE